MIFQFTGQRCWIFPTALIAAGDGVGFSSTTSAMRGSDNRAGNKVRLTLCPQQRAADIICVLVSFMVC